MIFELLDFLTSLFGGTLRGGGGSEFHMMPEIAVDRDGP